MCRYKQQTEVTYTRENKTRGYAHAVLFVQLYAPRACVDPEEGGGGRCPLIKIEFY